MSSASTPRRLGVAAYWACFCGIIWREVLRFLHQRERFLAALVRPLVWLFIFAAGFRQVLGVSIIPPYETYVLYEVFVTPGLIGMILLFNAMQSSLTMVYDRETGAMRTLLVSPFPRSFLLVSKLLGGVAVAVLQAYTFFAHRLFLGNRAPAHRISHATPGPGPCRIDAWFSRPLHILGHPSAREFRWRDELRYLPDVLCILGPLSALAHSGIEPPALRNLPAQPVYPRGRAHSLFALCEIGPYTTDAGRRFHPILSGCCDFRL